MKCPPGYICDRERLTSPMRPCLPGYYCFEGVSHMLSLDIDSQTNLPFKCTPGSYCREGMKTGVVIINANSSSPGACK